MRENRRGEYVQKQVRHYATLTGYTDNIPNFVRYIGATLWLYNFLLSMI